MIKIFIIDDHFLIIEGLYHLPPQVDKSMGTKNLWPKEYGIFF